MKVILLSLLALVLFQSYVLGQNMTDPYTAYDDEPITNSMNDTDIEEPSTHSMITTLSFVFIR